MPSKKSPRRQPPRKRRAAPKPKSTEPPRSQPLSIGVVFCRCGDNLADPLDLPALVQWARGQEHVSFTAENELLCSPAGRDYLVSLIRDHHPTHLVVAACSIRQQGATFDKAVSQAGFSPSRLQLANLREQAAWVTQDREAATRKARALLGAALRRVILHEELETRSMECVTDIVVIGGGIAGMEAALLGAAAGRKVTIVEKNLSLGGRIMQVEELSPNGECAPCLLSPRLSKIKDTPDIRVLAQAEVTGVKGFFGNFIVSVHQKPRFVKDTCIGCEACFEVCPVTVPSRFHLGLGTRKAIHTLFPGAVPANAAIDAAACRHFQNGSCDACVAACPFGAIDFTEQARDFEIPAGAIVVATGGEPFDPSDFTHLGYGRLPEVYTLPEFERLVNSNGPTQGVLRRRDGTVPRSVAVIHCAGSLSSHGLPYCSGLCCQLAVKVGAAVRKQIPDAQVTHYHDRLVFPGADAERFFEEQKQAGSRFLRTPDLAGLNVDPRKHRLVVSGRNVPATVADIVVLATGLAPGRDTEALATGLNLDRTVEGFFRSSHPFLRRVSATQEGVYAVGNSLGPCLAPAAVAQAQAAAGDAVSRLVPGRRIELERLTCVIDPEVCTGCRVCVSVCPFQAVSGEPAQNVSLINEALCQGCGTCAAACPSGAIRARQFTAGQLAAELKGVLHD